MAFALRSDLTALFTATWVDANGSFTAGLAI